MPIASLAITVASYPRFVGAIEKFSRSLHFRCDIRADLIHLLGAIVFNKQLFDVEITRSHVVFVKMHDE